MTGEELILIDKIVEEVCKNCKGYNKILGICRGELLPVERAVAKNLSARGLCDDVKNFVKEE